MQNRKKKKILNKFDTIIDTSVRKETKKKKRVRQKKRERKNAIDFFLAHTF